MNDDVGGRLIINQSISTSTGQRLRGCVSSPTINGQDFDVTKLFLVI